MIYLTHQYGCSDMFVADSAPAFIVVGTFVLFFIVSFFCWSCPLENPPCRVTKKNTKMFSSCDINPRFRCYFFIVKSTNKFGGGEGGVCLWMGSLFYFLLRLFCVEHSNDVLKIIQPQPQRLTVCGLAKAKAR